MKTWRSTLASAEREAGMAGQQEFQSCGAATSWARSARRCLTPRSNRAPTAKRQGRATVQVCFYCSAALALCRWCRFNSNVRPGLLASQRSSSQLGFEASPLCAPGTPGFSRHGRIVVARGTVCLRQHSRRAAPQHTGTALYCLLGHTVGIGGPQCSGYRLSVRRPRCLSLARPNTSHKLSPNSKTPGPRYSAVHHLQRGPGVLLPVPAFLER